MTHQDINPPPPLIDADRRVATDLLCIHCRYNLRTLAENALCPECGHPVANTTKLYRGLSSDWIRAVANAIYLIMGLIVGALALGALAAGLAALTFEPVIGLLFVSVFWIGVILLIAVVAVTRQEHPEAVVQEGMTARKVVRACVITGLVTIALGIIGFVMLLEGGGSVFFALDIFTAVLAAAVLPPALLRHITALMRRINRPRLASRFWTLSWLVVAAEALFVLGFLLDKLGTLPGEFLIAPAIVALALGILIAFDLRRAARALKDAAHLSAQFTTPQGDDAAPPSPPHQPPAP